MERELTIEIDDLFWQTPEGKYKILEFLIKKKGIWVFHSNDKDPFPSSPHGHNRETGEKLDVFTGKKYDPITKKCTGKLSQKILNEIQEKLKKQGLIK